jgi:hypothetical protein
MHAWLQDAGNAGAAVASCKAALALDVHCAEAHLLLGALLCERGAAGDAILAQAHLSAGLQRRPQDPQGWCAGALFFSPVFQPCCRPACMLPKQRAECWLLCQGSVSMCCEMPRARCEVALRRGS